MCQPKPGPRCAGHARTALVAARGDLREAEAAAAQVAPRWREVTRSQPEGSPAWTEVVAEYRAVTEARHAARAAYEQALRAYETTPAGQRDLATAADRLEAAGELAAARAARHRLAQARDTRARQVAELAARRAAATRLDAAGVEERAALAAAERDVDTAETQVAAARAALDAAEGWLAEAEAEQAKQAAVVLGRDEVCAAAARHTDAARREGWAAAKALYEAAGVPPRMAGLYAQDVVDGSGDGTLRMKVKRAGPDHAATAAARAAAAADPAFTAAGRRLAAAVEAEQAAAARRTEVYRGRYVPAVRASTEARGAVGQARAGLEGAERARAAAKGRVRRLRAQVAAGVGVGGAAVDLFGGDPDVIVRNPDGGTNAWVYQPPGPGWPDGRCVRVTGVAQLGASNLLVCEDGSRVHATQRYYRSLGGARTERVHPQVWVGPPAPGARPLRAEAQGGSGWASLVDSTD